MAKSVINPHQLQMIMTGRELQKKVTMSGDRFETETMHGMWNRKVAEAMEPAGHTHGGGTYESIAEHGWNPPADDQQTVELMHVADSLDEHTMHNTHHRVAAAAHLERTSGQQTYFPVTHHMAYGSSSWYLPEHDSSLTRETVKPSSKNTIGRNLSSGTLAKLNALRNAK